MRDGAKGAVGRQARRLDPQVRPLTVQDGEQERPQGVDIGARVDVLAAAAEIYQSPEMMRRLAADNQLEVSAVAEGALVRTTPVELLAGPGETAVVFTLTGGLGYTPVTVRGLARPDGWRLERQEDGVWGPLGQEVEGNDYWQAYDDPAQGGFHLVFNVHNRGSQTYRLIRVED